MKSGLTIAPQQLLPLCRRVMLKVLGLDLSVVLGTASGQHLSFLPLVGDPICHGASPACIFPQSFPPCDTKAVVPPQDTSHQSGLLVTPVCWLIFALPDSKNFALYLIKGCLPGSALTSLESQVYSHQSLALAPDLFASWKQKYQHPLVKDNKPNRICSLAPKQGSILRRWL